MNQNQLILQNVFVLLSDSSNFYLSIIEYPLLETNRYSLCKQRGFEMFVRSLSTKIFSTEENLFSVNNIVLLEYF